MSHKHTLLPSPFFSRKASAKLQLLMWMCVCGGGGGGGGGGGKDIMKIPLSILYTVSCVKLQFEERIMNLHHWTAP